MRADEMTKLLDDMVEIAEACGYEIPEGLDAEQFIGGVVEMVQNDKELDEEAREFFTEAVNALSEEDEGDESASASSAPAEKPEGGKKPFPFMKKGEKKDDDKKDDDKKEEPKKDDESSSSESESDEQDESVHFAIEGENTLVSEEMSTMLDQMVDLIETSGYEVEAGLSVGDFLEAVEELLAEKPELEEAKGAWLHKAHHAAKKAYSLAHAKPSKSGNVHAHTKLHKLPGLIK